MSVQLDTKTRPTPTRRRVRAVQARSGGVVQEPLVPGRRGPSAELARLDLIFEVALAVAACLSLIIVVHQAVAGDSGAHGDPAPVSTGQGVDDAPPAVFVQAD